MSAVAVSLALGTSKTGLSLVGQLADGDGDDVGAPITMGFLEFGGGNYGWIGEVPDGLRGFLSVADQADPDPPLAVVGLNPEETADPWAAVLSAPATPGTAAALLLASGGGSDPLGSAVPGDYPAGSAGHALARLLGSPITVVSPLMAAGRLRLVRGDAYLLAAGRAITMLRQDGEQWPADLAGWTPRLILKPQRGDVVTVTGTAPVPTGEQALRFQPTAEQTGALKDGRWQVTLTNGADRVTLREGVLDAVDPLTP